ncbi:cilia- and flagella-associated protein 44 isoform X2 [Athalia rosae]|uniref:cilia- and flagella-associated protein 44 isoform X2 n=1 Tax=Athalia rosae TaxID=37344 RepID=UPI0020340587|nr:cilia- and flagella-associated protein 44 isoform X2 [Athalia rosae]
MADTDDDIEKTENLPRDPTPPTVDVEENKTVADVEENVEEHAIHLDTNADTAVSKKEPLLVQNDQEPIVSSTNLKNRVIEAPNFGKEELELSPSTVSTNNYQQAETAGYESAEFEYDWYKDFEHPGEGGEHYSDTRIPYYSSEDYISGPTCVKDGTIPMNILEFHHSYAYDCRRHFNLCVADPDTIIFASGNLINFFNVPENKIWFRRGSTGGGIGHITKNPTHNHIAIGENGLNPPIIIYEWPTMEIVTILRQGTQRSYSHLGYSPDGLLLVSQGGEPDYIMTVWNWQRAKVMLRCKSHGQDIYNVTFSPSVPGHLTSSGSGHIKFWKMAKTFTGLKLKGELGRFGKTEISDIIGVYPMPDEKVVSGCEWGDILLWDEGLIKLEVCKTARKTCHEKLITQFEYNNGELMSVSMDGWIRIWFYETIDQADPPDDDRFIEIEPIYEFEIAENDADGDRSMLMSIQKTEPEDSDQTLWYAQDGNGGLWLIDICTSDFPQTPKKIFTCHAGPIVDMSVSTWGPFVATFGSNAHLHVYNYYTKRLILVHKFRDIGSQVAWLSCTVESTGSTMVCAFGSGVIRVITVAVQKADSQSNIRGDYVRLLQAIKPHSSPITAMSLNESNSLLVTGAEDTTVFVFGLQKTETYPLLIPIGYIRVPSSPTCFTWKLVETRVVLIGCAQGDCVEVEFPTNTVDYTTVSYELVRCELRKFKFVSVKSEIRRELFRLDLEKKKAAKTAVKMQQMAQLIADNPGINIDEEAFLMDSEEDPPYPEIYIPEVPNRVLFTSYTANNTIWLSMAGFDAGYIYEYPLPIPGTNIVKPIKSTMVFDGDDTEISSYLFYNGKKYLILGMQYGQIRVCRVNKHDHTDLSDYWILPMHDNYNGYIPKILLSHDNKMLLTCGYDGNLFSYIINDVGEYTESYLHPEIQSPPLPLPVREVDDIEELSHPSLEQVIVKAEQNRIMAVAKRKKSEVLNMLSSLGETYARILDRNHNLIKSQQIPHEDFELDPRITTDLNQHLEAEMNLVYRKLAFKVEKSKLRLQKLMTHFIQPITCLPFEVCKILAPDVAVKSFRERKLDASFLDACTEVEKRIKDRDDIGRRAAVKLEEEVEETLEKKKVSGIESFLKGLSPSTIQYRLGVKVNQMLRKYRARKARSEERLLEWKAMYAKKPDPHVNHPDDLTAIDHADHTIGDYKLKTSQNYSISKEQRENMLNKYKQFLDARKKAHRMREGFNDKLRNVRSKKEALLTEVNDLIYKLKKIHSEIPEKRIKPIPTVPHIDYNVEFPERNLEFERYVSMAEKVKEAKRTRKGFAMEIVLNPEDEEHELLLMDDKTVQLGRESSLTVLFMKMPEKRYRAQSAITEDVLQSLVSSDRVETPWEREMKRARVARKIYEQDCILEYIQESYQTLDRSLDELERERLEIEADSVYMELFILTLHQELIVLKEFEATEDMLTKKVTEKIEEKSIAQQKMQAMTTKIDQKKKEILKLHTKIKEQALEFMGMISENKFHDFLKRIFKKKYKPPKSEDESSSSSSSSTTESSSAQDDAGSIDSREIGPIHLDENICPAGCDQELYLAAFSMRDKRYEYEFQIKEEQKCIETLRKEIESDTKKMKIIENVLKSNQDDLQAFMREKQCKLNDIDMTVILKLHQFQHFKDDTTMEKIRDCVVFDDTKLTNLYARVGQLREETAEQKAKHRKNRMHLQRMNVDCKYMETEIHRLKSSIRQEMIGKFGREISLNSLYEAVLRRMIYDIKVSLTEMVPEFESQIQCIKNRYAKEIKILEGVIQDNTEKLSFLTVLEEEQLKLKKMLKHIPISEEEMLKIDSDYQRDLMKLETILKSQIQQKKQLQNEIKKLSLKSRPLPPIICQKKEGDKKQAKKKSMKKSVAIIDVETGEGLTFDQAESRYEESEEDEVDVGENDNEKGNKDKKTNVEEMCEKEENENNISQQLSEDRDDNTATMVHRLLSRIIQASLKDEDEGMEWDILREVISNLPIGGSREELQAGIEQSVEKVIQTLPQDDTDDVKAMRQAIQDIINEIVHRLDAEIKVIKMNSQDAKEIISELLRDIKMSDKTMIADLANSIVSLLAMQGGIVAATNHVIDNMPNDSSNKTIETVRKRVNTIFMDLSQQIAHPEQDTGNEFSEHRTLEKAKENESLEQSATPENEDLCVVQDEQQSTEDTGHTTEEISEPDRKL